jgi:hypothetical protein
MTQASQVKKRTIAFELIFGGFFPCRGRIDGREGDGRGLFWSMYLAVGTERMLYEGGCGGGRDGSLGGLWRDESIILNVTKAQNDWSCGRLAFQMLCDGPREWLVVVEEVRTRGKPWLMVCPEW